MSSKTSFELRAGRRKVVSTLCPCIASAVLVLAATFHYSINVYARTKGQITPGEAQYTWQDG